MLHSDHFMKLREWIPIDKLNWQRLSGNPNAIPILEQYLDRIEWCELSSNLNAIHLLFESQHDSSSEASFG